MEREFGYHAGYRVEHLAVGIFIICPHPCCLQSLPQEARYTIEISFQLNSPTISAFRGYYSQPTLLQPPHQILLYKIGCAKSPSLLQLSPAHTYCTVYKTSFCLPKAKFQSSGKGHQKPNRYSEAYVLSSIHLKNSTTLWSICSSSSAAVQARCWLGSQRSIPLCMSSSRTSWYRFSGL